MGICRICCKSENECTGHDEPQKPTVDEIEDAWGSDDALAAMYNAHEIVENFNEMTAEDTERKKALKRKIFDVAEVCINNIHLDFFPAKVKKKRG